MKFMLAKVYLRGARRSSRKDIWKIEYGISARRVCFGMVYLRGECVLEGGLKVGGEGALSRNF